MTIVVYKLTISNVFLFCSFFRRKLLHYTMKRSSYEKQPKRNFKLAWTLRYPMETKITQSYSKHNSDAPPAITDV